MKRFTETEKWKDPWFRALPPMQKLVFMYVIENCNSAGFYELDTCQMAFHTGLEEPVILGAIEGLNRGLLGAKGWLWVRTFLKHQKNESLNPENNAHRQIIAQLKEQVERFKECPEFRGLLGAHKGLFSPIGKVKVKVRSEGVQGEDFENFWQAYPRKDAKAKALDAWKNVKVELAILLEAVERQKRSEQWRKDRGKWIPLPASWLNGRRWEDAGAESELKPPIETTAAPREDRLEDPMEKLVRETLDAAG